MTRHPPQLRFGPGYRVVCPLQAPPLYPEEVRQPSPARMPSLTSHASPGALDIAPGPASHAQPVAHPSNGSERTIYRGANGTSSARRPGATRPAASPTNHVYLPPIATSPAMPFNGAGSPTSPTSGLSLRSERAKPYDRGMSPTNPSWAPRSPAQHARRDSSARSPSREEFRPANLALDRTFSVNGPARRPSIIASQPRVAQNSTDRKT